MSSNGTYASLRLRTFAIRFENRQLWRRLLTSHSALFQLSFSKYFQADVLFSFFDTLTTCSSFVSKASCYLFCYDLLYMKMTSEYAM
jgi:hypothetical protein